MIISCVTAVLQIVATVCTALTTSCWLAGHWFISQYTPISLFFMCFLQGKWAEILSHGVDHGFPMAILFQIFVVNIIQFFCCCDDSRFRIDYLPQRY